MLENVHEKLKSDEVISKIVKRIIHIKKHSIITNMANVPAFLFDHHLITRIQGEGDEIGAEIQEAGNSHKCYNCNDRGHDATV